MSNTYLHSNGTFGFGMFSPLLTLALVIIFATPVRAEGLVIPPPPSQPPHSVQEEEQSRLVEKSLLPDDIVDFFDHVRIAISAALATGSLQPYEFEKLDFTLPWNKGYGDNVAYEVFNPGGKIRAPLIADGGDFLKDNWEFHFSALTGRENSAVVFNLRRSVIADKKFEDVLYAIVPDIRQKFYIDNRYTQDVGGHPKCSVYPEQIKILSDNGRVIHDSSAITQNETVCLVMPDEKSYLFVQLAKRIVDMSVRPK